MGCAGNCLVLATILRSPDMRTARNVFIGNLAVSDLCLCVVTMPLTLVSHSIIVTALHYYTVCYTRSNQPFVWFLR